MNQPADRLNPEEWVSAAVQHGLQCHTTCLPEADPRSRVERSKPTDVVSSPCPTPVNRLEPSHATNRSHDLSRNNPTCKPKGLCHHRDVYKQVYTFQRFPGKIGQNRARLFIFKLQLHMYYDWLDLSESEADPTDS